MLLRRKTKAERRDSSKSKPMCYKCKQPDQIRLGCPQLKKARKGMLTKKKAMMTTWKDLDEEQEAKNQQEETEVANLCFMANIELETETKCS